MASTLPKLKPGKPLQIQFKKPHQKCTINSLTSTLKKLIPNIKEIKITSKKLPKNINNKKLYIEQVLRHSNVKKELKTQSSVKQIVKEIPDNKEVEYYPDKLKRKVDMKKIVLEPRHEYKVVAATNKRKRRTPKKDAGSPKKQKTDQSPENVSFEDMIPSSIIHKIKDYKNTFYKGRPETSDTLKNPITHTNLKNRSKDDLKNDPKTDPNHRSTNPELKSDSKVLGDLKTKSLEFKINQQLQYNLKTGEDAKTGTQEMEELMNEVSLSDEDFMEILTCPSPVWWEDPPDANYIEESIGSFKNQDNPPKTQDCTKVPSKTTHPTEKQKLTTKPFENKKLIEKRLKLESLLSSLKSNTVKPKQNNDRKRKISSDGSELSVDGEELVKSLQSINIPIQKQNIDEKHEIIHKTSIDTDFDQDKNQSKPKLGVNNAKVNKKQIDAEKIVINNEISIKSPDNESSIENVASNSPVKKVSPRKSNKVSPKKQQLTKYYNLKSKRPRIIKQNRNKIIIETIKTNYTQKTPEKKYNRKPNDVSKIKKAYLDLLKNSKIENNLTQTPETKKELNCITEEVNTKENTNSKHKDINTKENTNSKHKIDTSETQTNNNQENTNTKKENTKLNEIPLLLPKLTKIPKNLAFDSPKSIKSATSESTDINSEMDTISDTNIQYIDEYDSKKDELVTVYQIISKNDGCTK